MTVSKQEESHHSPAEQLHGLEFCVDSNPSCGEVVALGFQHYVLALGTAVMIPSFLVPLMGGGYGDKVKVIQTLLFVGGMNTLLQTLFGARLPTVIGGSYAFMIPIISIIRDPSLMRIEDDHVRFIKTMRAIQGALIASSCIQILLGFSQLCAIISRFCSPLGMVPVISLVGFGMFDRGFPVVAKCPEIGIPVLILFVFLSQYSKKFFIKRLPLLERYALLLSSTAIWVFAHLLTVSGAYKHTATVTQFNCRTDLANLISSASWLNFPYPFQWGAPTFNGEHCVGMIAGAIVSLIESTAAYNAAARLGSATPPPASIISRGIGWQGLGILLGGLWGSISGSTVLVENVGLMGSTRVGSRRVIQVSASFMILLSIIGKVGALFASIPFSIFAGLYCVLFGLVVAVGLSFLQFTNMNSLRNLFITGVSFSLGMSVPVYFREYTVKAFHGPVNTNARWFNDFLNTIFFSPPTMSFMIATFLDLTLDRKESRKDRGMPCWAKFRTFSGDGRSMEFYALPFNLDRFFPPA